ncbi:MAG: HPr family phosphocarrier protein [Clostridia bacterium]|nr:HPr family phosphocarrier protein [Clostridia bacterium]
MIETTIKLNTPKDVTEFVKLASKCSGEVYVCGRRYIVNGKSLPGIFSLDLSEKLRVEFHGNVPSEVKESMKNYIVSEVVN